MNPDHPDYNTKVTQHEGRIGVLEAGFQTLVSKIDGLTAAMVNSQRTNWPMLISLAGVMLVMIGGAWQLVELKTLVALAPLQAQSAISTEERQTLARRSDENKSIILAHSVDIGRLMEKTREIEQQFKRLGEGLNYFSAEQHRTNKLLWDGNKTMGEYPTGPYFFPSFSQHLPAH